MLPSVVAWLSHLPRGTGAVPSKASQTSVMSGVRGGSTHLEKCLDDPYWVEALRAQRRGGEMDTELQRRHNALLKENERLRARIEAALALHLPSFGGGYCPACEDGTKSPCPTVKALRGENDE